MILRPSVVCGTEDNFTNLFSKLSILPIIPVVGINYKFQPILVEDVADAIVKAIELKGNEGKIYEIGGPKVIPRISPKKTWAGVLAGWFAVALFSWSFVENVAPQSLFIKFVSISIILSVSAQVGDMIQSHLKRRSDVKDSSGLLPGHGGFMDRFDGFVGAMVVTGLIFEWVY